MSERSDKAMPCPFCGCDDIQSDWGWPEDPWARLECAQCGATLEARDTYDDRAAALEKWNSRAPKQVAATAPSTVFLEINPKNEPNKIAQMVMERLGTRQLPSVRGQFIPTK